MTNTKNKVLGLAVGPKDCECYSIHAPCSPKPNVYNLRWSIDINQIGFRTSPKMDIPAILGFGISPWVSLRHCVYLKNIRWHGGWVYCNMLGLHLNVDHQGLSIPLYELIKQAPLGNSCPWGFWWSIDLRLLSRSKVRYMMVIKWTCCMHA